MFFHLFAFFFFSFFSFVKSEIIYVDCENGNDSWDGLSETKAIKTVNALNSKISNGIKDYKLKAGCIFKDGISIVGKSGSSGSPLTFDMYGIGDKPKLDPSIFVDSNTFSSQGNDVYSISIGSEVVEVFIDDERVDIASYPPNDDKLLKNFFKKSSSNGNDHYIESSTYLDKLKTLSSFDIVGSHFLARAGQYMYLTSTVTAWNSGANMITSGSSSVKTWSGDTNPQKINNWFFLRNKKWMLDTCTNCWSYQDGKLYIKLKTGETITSKKISYLTDNEVDHSAVHISYSNYISIKNLHLQKSNRGINTEGSSGGNINLVVENCIIDSTYFGIKINNDPLYVTIKNNIIRNSGLYAIWGGASYYESSYNTIEHTFDNIRALRYTSNWQGTGIQTNCNSPANCKIQYNKVVDSGYNGIYSGGDGIDISYNFVKNSNLNYIDGASIYISVGSGHKVNNNLVVDALGNSYSYADPAGIGSTNMDHKCKAQGIYFDDKTENSEAKNNVLVNTNWNFQLHNSPGSVVTGNIGINSRESNLAVIEDTIANKFAGYTSNCVAEDNLFVTPYNENVLFAQWFDADFYDFYSTLNNNYYYGRGFTVKGKMGSFRTAEKTLEEWKTHTSNFPSLNYDQNSKKVMDFEGNFDDLSKTFRYYVNEDIYNTKEITLEREFCDKDGNVVSGKKVIQPLKAIVVFDCFCNNDGVCNNKETASTCPNDCDPVCGNGICEPGETHDSCPQDCSSGCGNGICSSGETWETCPIDCIVCGDGKCEGYENELNCPADCESNDPDPEDSCNPKCVHGECNNAKKICECENGWGTGDCSVPYCNNILGSDEKVCNGRGTCQSPNSCSCDSQHRGNECEFVIVPNVVCKNYTSEEDEVCSSHGSCVADNHCFCLDEYSGQNCEVYTPSSNMVPVSAIGTLLGVGIPILVVVFVVFSIIIVVLIIALFITCQKKNTKDVEMNNFQ